MNFSSIGLIAAASFLALGVAQADTRSLATEQIITLSNGYFMEGLSGSGKLTFSNRLINALNATKVTFDEVAPAQVTAGYLPGTNVYQSNGAVYVTAPVQSFSADFGEGSFTVNEVRTLGGVKQVTIKNGATAGAGDLTISNLRVVIGDRAGYGGTIYADLSSTTEGFVNRKGYALWSFAEMVGSNTYSHSETGPRRIELIDMATSLHGLFLVDGAEGKGLFQQALLLNNVGVAALNAVENRETTTNIDPVTGRVAGWGSITSSMQVRVIAPPIPEPSTWLLMCAGLSGVGVMVRRRARR